MNKKIVGEVTQVSVDPAEEVFLRAADLRPSLPSPADRVIVVSSPHRASAETAFRILKGRESIAGQTAAFYGVDLGSNDQTGMVVVDSMSQMPRSIVNWTDDDRRWVERLERNLPPRVPPRTAPNFAIQSEIAGNAMRNLSDYISRFVVTAADALRDAAFAMPAGGVLNFDTEGSTLAMLSLGEAVFSLRAPQPLAHGVVVQGLFDGPDFKYVVAVAQSLGIPIEPDAKGFTSALLHKHGISVPDFTSKVEFRIATAKATPVLIVKRHRRTYAGIPVVDVITEYGNRITVPANSVVGVPDETGAKL